MWAPGREALGTHPCWEFFLFNFVHVSRQSTIGGFEVDLQLCRSHLEERKAVRGGPKNGEGRVGRL